VTIAAIISCCRLVTGNVTQGDLEEDVAVVSGNAPWLPGGAASAPRCSLAGGLPGRGTTSEGGKGGRPCLGVFFGRMNGKI